MELSIQERDFLRVTGERLLDMNFNFIDDEEVCVRTVAGSGELDGHQAYKVCTLAHNVWPRDEATRAICTAIVFRYKGIDQ